MRVIQPSPMTDAVLVSSSVAETEHAEWSATTTYGVGARVIKAAAHRVYENARFNNVGRDPATASAADWIDLGSTNRWAMFDQAVGSATTAAGGITVTLAPLAPADALAVLDLSAETVRVQVALGGTSLYDRTQSTSTAGVRRTSLLFLDLPAREGARFTVTASSGSSAPVAVGTLIVGGVLELGTTEASPSIGISDFSRRVTDDFGVTTVVPRSWAKTMTLRTKVDTGDVDEVQRRVAAMRAVPALWIGEEGYDSLIVYGFFRSFSIDLALPRISYCSFGIEGLAA